MYVIETVHSVSNASFLEQREGLQSDSGSENVCEENRRRSIADSILIAVDHCFIYKTSFLNDFRFTLRSTGAKHLHN